MSKAGELTIVFDEVIENKIVESWIKKTTESKEALDALYEMYLDKAVEFFNSDDRSKSIIQMALEQMIEEEKKKEKKH